MCVVLLDPEMMPTMEASYQQFGGGDPDDSEETPQEFGAMIHIVPESGKCRPTSIPFL